MSLELLKKYNIKAKKSLGQNFLVNENIVRQIADSIDIEGENIVEVGPGYGVLTERILEKKPNSLDLVELDKDMINILRSRVQKGELRTDELNFNIKNTDVLKYEPSFDLGNYLVIANIPYYITSPILRHFLYDVKNKPKKMLILMQKDVGDKILGKGKNKSSVLSLFISKKCYVNEILFVGKENFIPAPKVESSVLLFELHNMYNSIDNEKFLDFIKKAFKEPRKKLFKNLLSSGFEKEILVDLFEKLDINENIRAEDLDISMWIKITEIIG